MAEYSIFHKYHPKSVAKYETVIHNLTLEYPTGGCAEVKKLGKRAVHLTEGVPHPQPNPRHVLFIGFYRHISKARFVCRIHSICGPILIASTATLYRKNKDLFCIELNRVKIKIDIWLPWSIIPSRFWAAISITGSTRSHNPDPRPSM